MLVEWATALVFVCPKVTVTVGLVVAVVMDVVNGIDTLVTGVVARTGEVKVAEGVKEDKGSKHDT
jgi:hypothetical protein